MKSDEWQDGDWDMFDETEGWVYVLQRNDMDLIVVSCEPFIKADMAASRVDPLLDDHPSKAEAMRILAALKGPTCDVEVAAEAILPTYLAAYAPSISTTELRAEPEDYAFLLNRCRGIVRAVLAHVHPQPREQKP